MRKCLFVALVLLVTGIPVLSQSRGLPQFDAIMQDQLTRHHVPGGTLALAYRGRLVLARGYGFADLEQRIPPEPSTLFGLASISKSFTAAAVLKLVEAGKLNLDDPILPYLQRLRTPGAPLPQGMERITVRMLLNHSSGFGRSATVPGEFEEMNRSAQQAIRDTLRQPLKYPPGTRAVYSNFGFVVLGYIVETVSGRPYGAFVQDNVLHPMGIVDARLPGKEPRYLPQEALRYSPRETLLPPALAPIGGPAGGWEASAVDLVRFLVAMDGSGAGRTFLSPETMQEVLAPPPPPLKPRANGSYFGLGWDIVRPTPTGFNYSKNGSLGGVRSNFGHLDIGVDWAVLFNGGDKQIDADAATRIIKAAHETTDWPNVDAF